jgi:hypothetical protein
MSLIDEALKRAELEAARRDGLRGGAYPWVPEHMPRRHRRGWGWIVAIVAGVAAIATGLLLWPRGETPVIQNPESKIQNLPGPSQKLETVEVAPPPVGLPSHVLSRDKDAANTKVGNESKRPTPPFDTARARIAPSRESSSATGAADARPARGLAEGRTYAGELSLPDGPKIALEGIVFSETNPVALINGKVLPPGGVVEEFTIVSIKPDRVELNGRGVTIVVTLK